MRLIIFIMICLGFSCSQDKKPIKGDTPFQKKMNAEFKDATTSPLKKKDLKNFDGLEFFEFDSTYVVRAELKRTPDSEWFKMKMTDGDVSLERVYGILDFTLRNKKYNLKVYQGKELMNQSGWEDYLFLPFLDETNGLTTYGGGRYIDLKIPESTTIKIDFNTAYNPLCAYNEKYSCPIVPRDNYLNTEIKAGVKAFEKS